MSFYVILPSNGADLTTEEGKRDNTQTQFTIKLNQTLEFNKPYEVALVESWFSMNWKIDVAKIKIFLKNKLLIESNIESFDGVSIMNLMTIVNITLKNDMSKFFLHLTEEKKLELAKEFELTEINKNAINLFLKKISLINIESTENEGHYRLTLPKLFKLEIGGFLANYMKNNSTLLELGENFFINDSKIKKIQNLEDRVIIEGNDAVIHEFFIRQTKINIIQELYLYTDIIDYQFVGSEMARLLRVITVDNKQDSLIHLSFLDPHYLSVNKNRLNSIKLKLADERGEPVKFSDTTSRVIYKLHFRPINRTL